MQDCIAKVQDCNNYRRSERFAKVARTSFSHNLFLQSRWFLSRHSLKRAPALVSYTKTRPGPTVVKNLRLILLSF